MFTLLEGAGCDQKLWMEIRQPSRNHVPFMVVYVQQDFTINIENDNNDNNNVNVLPVQ